MPRNNDSITLNQESKIVLMGTVMGDGSMNIHKRYKNARFQMKHCVKQREWFMWKTEKLKKVHTRNSIHEDNTGYSNTPCLHFLTRAALCLTMVFRIMYSSTEVKDSSGVVIGTENVRYLQKAWLETLDETALMAWWLDDGGRIGAGPRRGRCNTQNFSLAENTLLKEFLWDSWGVATTIQVCWAKTPETAKIPEASFLDTARIAAEDANDGEFAQDCIEPASGRVGYNKYFYLQLSTNALKVLLRKIMPVIPVESMVYKAFLVYKDESFQQSWIAEMKNAMPRFFAEIDRLYDQSRQET